MTLVDELFVTGGEMGALMRRIDWTKTSLGPFDSWPQSLRTTVSTCLASRFPILVWWGRDLVKIYNDAYRPIGERSIPRRSTGATRRGKEDGREGARRMTQPAIGRRTDRAAREPNGPLPAEPSTARAP